MTQRIAPPPRGKTNVRSDFRVGEFEIAIEQQGYRIYWEQASICPCRSNAEGGQPNFNCHLCKGIGYEHHSGQEIKAIMDRARGDQLELDVNGAYIKRHSAEFTVLAQHRPSHYHRYTLLDSVMEHSEVIVGAAGMPLTLTYPIARTAMNLQTESVVGNVTTEELYFDVLRCRIMDPQTRKAGRLLIPRADFHVQLDEQGNRYLMLDAALADEYQPSNLVVAVTYYINPRFLVMDYTYSIRDTYVKFKRVDLRYEAMPITVTGKLDVDQGRAVNSGADYQGAY